METIQLSVPHYVFLLTVLSIFIAIGFRRGVIIPALAGTFLIGILSADRTASVLDQLIFGIQVLFKALLNAGGELFGIMAVIALMARRWRQSRDPVSSKILSTASGSHDVGMEFFDLRPRRFDGPYLPPDQVA